MIDLKKLRQDVDSWSATDQDFILSVGETRELLDIIDTMAGQKLAEAYSDKATQDVSRFIGKEVERQVREWMVKAHGEDFTARMQKMGQMCVDLEMKVRELSAENERLRSCLK